MSDRFKDAQWIHGVPPTGTVRHETGVYGTLACGHPTIVADTAGHSCNRSGRQEDQEANARLIAVAPELLQAAKALLQRGPVGIESECHWCGREGEDTEHCSNDDCMGTLARAAIAKAEGPDGGYARLLDTDPKFESFVRGYIDKAEGRA